MTIEEAKIVLAKEYHIDNFTYLAQDVLLPDYAGDVHDVWFKNDIFSTVKQLGTSDACELTVFEVYLNEGTQNRRVAITQEMFKILRGLHINNALVAFVNTNEKNFRISLLTSKYEFNGDKIVKVLSNPRRFSYTLGIGMKTKTAYKFLIEKGKVKDLNELIGRFSVEVVNKQFYAEIATAFTELVGGERNGKTYTKLLQLYGSLDHNKYAEFGVRLIGRIMFCWFLNEKRSENGVPLVPDDMLSVDRIDGSNNYYHQVLEPLFFELLNTPINSRKPEYNTEYYKRIPYLNGGLFSPHTDEYRYDSVLRSGKYGLVTIPNEWFRKLYQILGQYNFTVDENTAYDIELSIDPEMLGRIFENLLAEINPETGENAKKSTGSFYTPRDIVDYMVDSSLCEYLKTKTGIDEVKLKALISYSKDDAELAVFNAIEKKKLIEALYTITVLDPACGSGAFPIGMLQKIVYILQEVDPGADLWFDAMVKGVPIYVKQAFETKFRNKELDWLRKITVIEKSIYGIDIQPIAVEISRLRCFLSLIIEEKVDDKADDRGIQPLPNLDFKFIIANSLIPLERKETKSSMKREDGTHMFAAQISLFEEIDHIDKLKDIREEFFNAKRERRQELKLEFMQVQQDMLLNTITQYNKQASKKYQQLSEWKPFENKPTDWFDSEWMFGVKEGFDIIIANPPYGANIDAMVDLYKTLYIKTNKSYAEIYKMFFEQGFNLLKKDGLLCYITPNTYLSQPRYKDLRCYLLKQKIIEITNLGEGVFRDVIVPVCISLFCKKEASVEYVLRDLRIQSSFSGEFSSANTYHIKISDVLTKQDLSMYQIVSENGMLCFDNVFIIKDAGIQYHRSNIGLKNKGGNDLFERIVSNDSNYFTNSKPIYYGKLINRYYISERTDEFFNLDYKNVLKSNETVSFSEIAFLQHPKIIWRQTASYPLATLDAEGIWFRNTIQCAWIKDDYVSELSYYSALAIFNSKYIRYLYNKLVQEAGRVFPQIKITHLKKLPIKIPSKEMQNELDTLVQSALNMAQNGMDTQKNDEEIDKIIFQLYELSADEIAQVENSK